MLLFGGLTIGWAVGELKLVQGKYRAYRVEALLKAALHYTHPKSR